MPRLNVLVLHRMGDPRYRRESVRALECMIPECRPDFNCIVHDADLPFPLFLKDIDFHLIVLGPTFLCSRYNKALFENTLEIYEFIANVPACKVALPQDDYDCSGILDEWMVNWSIDRIYTVCPEHWDILYPKSLKQTQIKLGYTGYISDQWLKSWRDPKPHALRKIDVSYRASKLPANFGSNGQLKWEIAHKFTKALRNKSNLLLDISVDPQDMIPGEKWHEFVEESRFCLATPSGSSLLDPQNKIRACVNNYLIKRPNASYQEIERHCFPTQDGIRMFTAISPRNIEAALAETVQVATLGSYSSLMYPVEHYIPLNQDCSNIKDVLSMMADQYLVDSIKLNCKEKILSEPRLRRTVIVDEIVQFAEEVISNRNVTGSKQVTMERVIRKYERENKYVAWMFWKKQRFFSGLRAAALRITHGIST